MPPQYLLLMMSSLVTRRRRKRAEDFGEVEGGPPSAPSRGAKDGCSGIKPLSTRKSVKSDSPGGRGAGPSDCFETVPWVPKSLVPCWMSWSLDGAAAAACRRVTDGSLGGISVGFNGGGRSDLRWTEAVVSPNGGEGSGASVEAAAAARRAAMMLDGDGLSEDMRGKVAKEAVLERLRAVCCVHKKKIQLLVVVRVMAINHKTLASLVL